MALQLQIFEYEEDERLSNVRTIIMEDGEVWWVAKDVCEVLGISNHRNAVSRLDNDEKDEVDLADSIGRLQKMVIINEPGMYSLIIRSDKPEAKRFKRWITHEVIPQIRKTGSYGLRGAGIPIFVRRFNDNWDRVDKGYFSVINELFIRVYGKLEQLGYVLPDKTRKGVELRPDVSVGKLFPKWLEARHPQFAGAFKHYNHRLPDGMEVRARQYANIVLPEFIEYVETVWITQHAENYFKERDPKALNYLPKLLSSPSED